MIRNPGGFNFSKEDLVNLGPAGWIFQKWVDPRLDHENDCLASGKQNEITATAIEMVSYVDL